MAFFQYLSEADNDCLHKSYNHLLEKIGLDISKEFSSHAQIFAEVRAQNSIPHAKVKVLISWIDKSIRCCSIEIRSDEPFLKKNTCCERIAKDLSILIPPINLYQENSSISRDQ